MKRGTIKLGRSMAMGSTIDLDRLIATRLLIQGGSGSGKSTLARRLLEQTVGSIQQIIIDPEGEFSTLRKVGDYLLCSADGDVPTEVKSAAVLAKRIRSTGVSAIVDVYELKPHERLTFVSRFLEGMMVAPKKDWRPCLLFIDETHVFAPQARTSECLFAVQDMAARGRKRKIGLICATQRLSKLHKDVVAELQNRLIGQTGLKNDLKTAAEEMGLTFAEARENLLVLKPGEFYSFGPALAPEYTRFQGAMTKTRAADADSPAIGASASLSKVIESLADLPKQAAKEAQTLADLQRNVIDYKREIRALKAGAKAGFISQADADKQILEALARAPKPEPAVDVLKIISAAESIIDVASKRPGSNPLPPAGRQRPRPSPNPPPTMRERTIATVARNGNAGDLTTPEQRILNAIAWMESIGVDTPEQTVVAFLAEYRYGGGAFNNPRGRLRMKGLVEYVGKQIRLTAAGRDIAVFPDIEPSVEGLHAAIMGRLNGPERKILQPLLNAYPNPMANDDLAAAAGYALGGAFNNPKGRLRSLGLIEYPQSGYAAARQILFPEPSGT